MAQLSAAIKRLKQKSEQQTNQEIRDEKITALYYLLLSFTTEGLLIKSMLMEYLKPEEQENIAEAPQCIKCITAIPQAQNKMEINCLSFEEAQGKEGKLESATKLKKKR